MAPLLPKLQTFLFKQFKFVQSAIFYIPYSFLPACPDNLPNIVDQTVCYLYVWYAINKIYPKVTKIFCSFRFVEIIISNSDL